MTMSIEYSLYSRLFPEWVTPDHDITHAQFSSGVTIWQRVLRRVVNTLHVRANSVNQRCANSRRKNYFVLTLDFLLTSTWNSTIMSQFWLS